MNHPNKGYFDDIVLNEYLDKELLLDYLMFEYRDMETVDSNSDYFHERIIMFFKIHKWNIDKLAATLQFEYDPIGNVNWKDHDEWQRNEQIDFHSDRDRDEAIDTKTIEDRDWTEHGHTTEVTDDDWTEHDTTDETDVNLVSAYNDNPSPQGNPPNATYIDTEHHRDVIHVEVDKVGTDDKTVNTDYSKDGTDDKDTTFHSDDAEDEAITSVQTEDEHKDENEERWGHESGHSFQELIEEERRQAQFNIYKWIARHFCKELLIAVW